MTDRVASLPDDQFTDIWDTSASLDEAVDRVRAVVGLPCSRWAVRARAAQLRRAGVPLRPTTGPLDPRAP